MVLFSPTLVSIKFPAPVLAVVSTVIVPTAAAVLPSCRNTVLRNESAVADGVGVGEGDGVGLGVGDAVGVGVGVDELELETEPQPTSQNAEMSNNKAVILRSMSSPKNLGLVNRGTVAL